MISNNDLLLTLIKQCSKKYNISQEYVEKDYYAISLLKQLCEKRTEIVFKGGTCLSKCFKIINRFSEDIDVSLDVERLSYKERKILAHSNIENSLLEVNLKLLNKDSIRSRRWFNQYRGEYESVISNNSSNNIILELATQSPSFPEEIKECQTFIGEYLDSIGQHDLCVEYGLEKFPVKVQKLERTFVDKVYAICDYQISKKLTRNSRHIYDLHRILPLIKLDSSLVDLFYKIREYRLINPMCYSVLGDYKLHELVSNIIKEDTFKNDFNNVTKPLLYDTTEYSKCIKSLEIIKQFLKDNNL